MSFLGISGYIYDNDGNSATAFGRDKNKIPLRINVPALA